ncbi:hypothetical protein [Nocardioides abyssi]|uniref:Antitoxin VbhA domain-containing protein n=1 Tax=Nocardioides abyssi TaxID=3058370 RepID=A0ABT8EQP4_9ACTN|nr:hypothetical protein [Nocardioides abyssi]MDN4160459.1 hypothetical protein [Nocardioides abyssi]
MSNERTDEADLRAATQQAVDAAATAYTEDASIDLEDTLRREMAQGGMALDDDAWVREVARAIRSGHHVSFAPEGDAGAAGAVGDGADEQPTSPGSLGGDNGGA